MSAVLKTGGRRHYVAADGALEAATVGMWLPKL